MGTHTDSFPPQRPLSEHERRRAALSALKDGTARRLRESSGWTADDLAERLGVPGAPIEAWEQGLSFPDPDTALALWVVLVDACRTAPPWD